MKNLAGITARYIEKPFSKIGCIELVCAIAEDLGTPLPREVDGWNLKNYKSLVNENIKRAQNVMIEAFKKIGEPGNEKFPSVGDLLIIEQDGDIKFPAIYVGKKQAIASFIKVGVRVFKIDDFNRIIICRKIN